MPRHQTVSLGVARANRTGAMVLLITLCQHLIPAVFLQLLRWCGIDTSAHGWGLTPALFLCLYLAIYVLMTGVPLWLCARWLIPASAARPRARRLSADHRLCLVLLGVALCLLANIVAALFSGLLRNAQAPVFSSLLVGDGSVLMLLFDLLVFAVVPAVMEEQLLRGIVLQTLRPLGPTTAVLMSSLLFALMHGNMRQVPYTLLMGLVLGTLYILTDDLRLTITVHALANGLSVTAGFLLEYFSASVASFWELVILIVTWMLGGLACLHLWRHPLPPRRSTKKTIHNHAVFHAPFLWLAIAVMVILMIVAGTQS